MAELAGNSRRLNDGCVEAEWARRRVIVRWKQVIVGNSYEHKGPDSDITPLLLESNSIHTRGIMAMATASLVRGQKLFRFVIMNRIYVGTYTGVVL
jgi:hypothetical protein